MPSSPKIAVGFGANYFLNMGTAVQSKLSYKDTEGELQEVNSYSLESGPWDDENDELVQVATSSGSSYFLTERGKVYSCGTQHGKVNPSLTRIEIQLPLKCVQISAGRHFALARMEGGLAVCSWGAGHFGQLALGGDSPPFISHPTVIESLLPHVVGAPISSICAGYWHAMAVTQAGAVYSWGCNRTAQCGFKPTKDPPTLCLPQRVRFETPQSPKMVKAAAGRSHSVSLDEDGKVYSWGACQYGQCGVLTRRRGGVAPPKQVESLSQVQIIDIAAGDTHTLALTGGGRVFGFGGGFEGQLGTGSIVQMNPKPKLVGDLDFVAIEAGREWKSQQKLKQDMTDDTINSESASDLSLGSSAHASLSQVPKIVSLNASGNCSMALSSTGHLYVWGCNDVGNLGVPKLDPDQMPFIEPALPPTKTSTLRQFHSQSFDSSHNVGLPQRVDCLGHVNITSIAASPTFVWCLGTERRDGNEDATAIGRTLYEVQEAKRQKSLRQHRHSRNSDDNASPSLDLNVSQLESNDDSKQRDQTIGGPLDPPEMKDGSQVDAGTSTVASGSTTMAATKRLVHSSSLDSAEVNQTTGSRPPKSPGLGNPKRRFSLPKAIGNIVRRASLGNSFRGSRGGEDTDKKGRKA